VVEAGTLSAAAACSSRRDGDVIHMMYFERKRLGRGWRSSGAWMTAAETRGLFSNDKDSSAFGNLSIDYDI